LLSTRTLEVPTPRIFLPLLGPERFKGVKGGRGSGKSHFLAEQIVVEAATEHIRAACLREHQNSIQDSVKQLLEDKIHTLGLDDRFKITDREITGPYDSLFVFKGLKSHTVASIKSLEGFNRALVEEAQTISQKSMDIMTPTFRAPGAQIRFAWNPNFPDDPVDAFFEANKGHPDFVLVHANWAHNPWFPQELRGDMERDRLRDPDKYLHVWEGEYSLNSEARVFKNWTVEEFDSPGDAIYRFGADWGFAVDPTVLIRCWVKGRTLFVDREAWAVGCEIDATPDLFDRVQGARDWMITADSARPETVSYMRRAGFKIMSAIKGPGSLEDGIQFLKSFDIVVHPRCKHVIDELTHYAFKTDPLTGQITPLLEDKNNHTIDALRYALEALRRVAPKPNLVMSRNPSDLGAWRNHKSEGGSDWRTI